MTKTKTKTAHPAYVGCDLLLTSDRGQGIVSDNTSRRPRTG